MAKLKAGWIETRRLADGTYRALLRYRDPLSGQKLLYGDALYADTAAEAEKKAAELQPQLAEYLQGRRQARRAPESMALADFVLIDWKQHYEPKLPPSTKALMRQWWNKWLEPLIGGASLSEITPALVEGFAEHMQAMGAAWPTVETAVKHVRSYIRDAAKEGYAEKGQLDELDVRPPELSAEEVAALAEPEFALELEHAVRIAWSLNGLEDTAIAEAMAVGGLRLGEARALTFDGVLHPDGRPRTRFQVRLAVSGRGSERILRGTKKTRGLSLRAIQRGYRRPELVPALGALFVRLWQERDRPPLSELVAPGAPEATLGVKNEANWRRREFAPAVERSGVGELYSGKKITPREFRAAAAAAYGHAQVPELSARDQLGHASDSTTLRFYFAAYEDPNPALRGLSVDEQLVRARRLALEWMEARIEQLAAERESVGQNKLLSWKRQGSGADASYTAESVNGSRYLINRAGKSFDIQLLLGDNGSLRAKTIRSNVATLADAKDAAERQAIKRTRQSLTIQRQRFERQLVHLRALVAEREAQVD
jgi:integrase